MPCCFAPGCSTGSANTIRRNKKLGLKNTSMFTAPKDAELFELWKKVIPRKDRSLNHGDRICELHFTEDCIIRTYVTKIFDGTVSVIGRERPTLKHGSIPTIFPNLPYKLKLSPEMLETKELKHIPRSRKKKIKSNSSYDQNVTVTFKNKSHKKEFNYVQLIESLNEIQRPNLWWTVSQCEDFVICSKWNATYCSDRKVIICQDLSSKVFIENIEVPSLNVDIHSIEDLSSLLHLTEKLITC